MQSHSSVRHEYPAAGYGTKIEHRTNDKAPAPMKVFIVEDSAPIRERLVEMIADIDGFMVVGEASTCKEAVSGILRARPDIAICDIQLASGSGLDALSEVRRTLPGLRAIVLTNYATPQHEKAALDAGAEYFLDKSADFEKITEILEGLKDEINGRSN